VHALINPKARIVKVAAMLTRQPLHPDGSEGPLPEVMIADWHDSRSTNNTKKHNAGEEVDAICVNEVEIR
jgi:hypothetical protein